ncbi:MAG: hypothetical protein AAF310_06000 [Myxococcota bacterium]
MPNSTPETYLAQVKWDQHSSSDLHTHVYVNHYGGSLTFLAEKIYPRVTHKQLLGAQILTIAGQDYADAMLLIQHVLPLAHRGKPTLIKAFFSATQVPLPGSC